MAGQTFCPLNRKPIWRDSKEAVFIGSFGRSGRICDCLFETLKSLRFSYAAFDFVYSPCVLYQGVCKPYPIATHKPASPF